MASVFAGKDTRSGRTMQHIGAAETVTGLLRRIGEAEKRGLSVISIEGSIVSGDFEYTFPAPGSAAAMRGTLTHIEKDPRVCAG